MNSNYSSGRGYAIRDLSYESVQNYCFQNKLLEREHNRPRHNQNILKTADYERILEIMWDFMRKGLLIPHLKSNPHDMNPSMSGILSQKGRRFLETSPTPYSDFMENLKKIENIEEPTELIKKENEIQVKDAINCFTSIKAIIDLNDKVNDDEKEFLTQDVFKKIWNPNSI